MAEQPEGAHPDGPRLQELLRRRKDQLKLTQEEMVARAREAGLPLSRATINKYLNPITAIPKEEVVRALAVALDLDSDAITDAALRSVPRLQLRQKRVQVDEKTRVMLGMFGPRTPEEQDALIDVVRSVIRSLDARQHAHELQDDDRRAADGGPGGR